MPCGCQNACGCVVLGDGFTTTAVTVGDTTTVSAIQTFLGVSDTNCISMAVALGIVSASLVIDPITQSVIVSCGAAGVIANLKLDPTPTAVIHSVSNAGLTSILRLDPASSAPVSQSVAGLRVDCCPETPPAIADTPTVDLVTTLGVLTANVIPNTAAGLENQAGGVAIKLQGDPAPLGGLVCGTRLRFNNVGDLVDLQNGIQVSSVPAGAVVGLAATQGNFGGTSNSNLFTNSDTCPVYVLFKCVGIITCPSDGSAATTRRTSQQMQLFVNAVTGGATDVGASGLAAFSDYNYQGNGPNAIPIAQAWRVQAELSKWVYMPPGSTVTMQTRTLCLENIVGWQTTVPNGASFQTNNYIKAVYPERIGGWLVA